MRIFIIFTVFTYILSVNTKKEVIKSKNPLPYFRRQVEEIPDDVSVEKVTEDSRGKLLSLFVKKAKELFHDNSDDITEPRHETGPIDNNIMASTADFMIPTRTTMFKLHDVDFVTMEGTTSMFKLLADDLLTIEDSASLYKLRDDDVVTIERTKDEMLYENLSISTVNQEVDVLLTKFDTPRRRLKENIKEMKSFEKSDIVIHDVTPLITSISSYVLEPTDMVTQDTVNKTCIFCNNVLSENCIDPKNKLVPSIVCERDHDLCYSLHTPFGIVDRGCFNVNHNLTTYVCSCNLCNYISISEMPYLFSKKQEWLDNIIELSRTRNFRKSIFKDMSCLRCEVNTTVKSETMVDSANCMEGNIASLPIQICAENEICGVKAVRSDGYIWRGCIRAPLYNYWWTLCDDDLCNHDALVSIYDHFTV